MERRHFLGGPQLEETVMTTANLTLPYSLEAEQEVLGGLMLRVAFIVEQPALPLCMPTPCGKERPDAP